MYIYFDKKTTQGKLIIKSPKIKSVLFSFIFLPPPPPGPLYPPPLPRVDRMYLFYIL